MPMTQSRAALAAALFLPLAACATSAAPSLGDPLAGDIAALQGRHADRTIAVAYRDLGTGRTVLGDADTVLHAASTMKVPVMIEVFRQAAQGRFTLDATLPVTDTFPSIVDGSPFTLKAEDDSETTLYARIGEQVAIRELVRLMIVRSSNLATNLLVALVGAPAVQDTIEDLGTRRMKVLRGVEDTKAWERGRNNVTTARDLLVIMEALARGRGMRPDDAREMVAILKGQEFNEMIPAGLPEAVRPRVAHKTGQITGIHHDAAIVYPDGAPPFVLVVLTAGFDRPADSAAVVAEVAALAWKHHHFGP